jgi:hypothetical protein
VTAPHFTVCPSAGKATCTIGTLAKGQADELQAESWVRASATGGEQIELTASALGKDAGSYKASGSVEVITSTPTTSTSIPPVTVTIPPSTLAPYPGVGTGGGGTGGLFPTVSPSPGSTGVGFPSASKQPVRARAAADASTVPLDPKLIGGQLAGLAVLVAAIAIAIARLSLRRPRPQDGPSTTDQKK